MPNFKTHAMAGVASGIGVSLYEYQRCKEKYPNIDFDLPQLIFNIAAGLAGAILPDKLEPAYHPNHRSSCHSLVAAGVNAGGINATGDSEQLDPRWKSAAKSFFIGYLSHLVLDGRTPKGLPLV